MQNKFIEHTVILVKPEGMARGLVGEVITRFEKVGFKIVAMKLIWVDKKLVGKHYKNERAYLIKIGERTLADYKKYGMDPGEGLGTKDPYKLGQMVRKWNMIGLSRGPLVAILLEGVAAVEVARKIAGETVTVNAMPGTIRGDFSSDAPIVANLEGRSIKTIIHASGSREEAEFEKKLWFKNEEIYSY